MSLRMKGGVIFKQADTCLELDQIHRLNYRTFAEELGQYIPDGSGVLIDRFHDRNVYFVALRGTQVIGMVAAQDRPPFSIESRLPDPSVLRSLGGSLLEVRLLAIEPDSRYRLILPGLLLALYQYACERPYSHLIISGITNKIKMYQRIGRSNSHYPVPRRISHGATDPVRRARASCPFPIFTANVPPTERRSRLFRFPGMLLFRRRLFLQIFEPFSQSKTNATFFCVSPDRLRWVTK